MALNIKSQAADTLARELALETGESLTTAVTKALEERLDRVRRRGGGARLEAMREIRRRVSSLPTLDDRNDDEILGYGPDGSFEG